MAGPSKPILIIGAGISGLTAAQACRKENLPFRIFERDASADHRSAGWGLTLNWALPAFKSILPDDIVQRLPETFVNKEAVDAGAKGSFRYFDLSTGEAKWSVPVTAERIRVSRERLRKLLLTGLDVRWSMALVDISEASDGVTATFGDGSSVTGSLLLGCDGANSRARRLCHPEGGFENEELPVRFIGVGVHYSEEQVRAIHRLDPYFLQGSDPRSDVFLWFSFLNTPSDPDGGGEGRGDRTYYCQVMTSWPVRPGFLGRADPTEMPNTKLGQLSLMKAFAADWAEPFRSIVRDIPADDAEVLPIRLADWPPRHRRPSSSSAAGPAPRVVLLGDAAHAMVMYRGEGANHAIVDVERLLRHIAPLMRAGALDNDKNNNNDDDDDSRARLRDALHAYETEMIARTDPAVRASRQACLDAHDFKRLNDDSPLVRRRLMRADLE